MKLNLISDGIPIKYRPSDVVPFVELEAVTRIETVKQERQHLLEEVESGSVEDYTLVVDKNAERPGIRGEILLQPGFINGFYTRDESTFSQLSTATGKLVQNEFQAITRIARLTIS